MVILLIYYLICLDFGCLELLWNKLWGKQKFIFFYLSAGFGAVLIQTIVYHYDVMSVTQILIDNGLTNTDVNTFYETGRLNTGIIQSVGEERLYSGIQSFKAVMVGGFRCVIWNFSGLCNVIS